MKPERDPELCDSVGCDELATTATPAGKLCEQHASELGDELDDDQDDDRRRPGQEGYWSDLADHADEQ